MSRLDARASGRQVSERAGAGADRVTSDMALSLLPTKVRDWHLQRKAVVYIRQSTACGRLGITPFLAKECRCPRLIESNTVP